MNFSVAAQPVGRPQPRLAWAQARCSIRKHCGSSAPCAPAPLLCGVLLTVAVGGAGMPVIIALLNSCLGLAAVVTGFVLGNNVPTISGSLVGASGFILAQIVQGHEPFAVGRLAGRSGRSGSE